jgi:prepilin-type processing-associated H-X9-DG protein
LPYSGDAKYRGRRNYAMCQGDMILNNHSATNNRGIFGYLSATTFADIRDGSSNTILLAEKANAVDAYDVRGLGANNISGTNTNPSLCLATAVGGRYIVPTQSSRVLGSLWHSGLSPFVGVTTVLPPNSPTCMVDNWGDQWSLNSASSYHPAGVNVAMADGAVRFIVESIDCGTLTSPEVTSGRSPYGVWGALGTRAGSEIFSNAMD